MNHNLFLSLPIGELFFRDPFNANEGLSIKVDSNHARNPQGEVKEVHPHVLVFTGEFNNEIEHNIEDITFYRVKGTRRQVGAIGTHEKFTEKVAAYDSDEAVTEARDRQYSKNFEHVNIKSVEFLSQDGKHWLPAYWRA